MRGYPPKQKKMLIFYISKYKNNIVPKNKYEPQLQNAFIFHTMNSNLLFRNNKINKIN